ncbi:DegT/DnrJ/EryC1/StrS family aminotransferase [Paenibacillus thiaminolyticus]|uniref:DegT/DnrJ/EryC1/StrS family aminotransferase n=1 Tax=Paenibacillus thiaminolyticus TaxID=49283 RepID=UPI002543176F|nr:DegT/DnrJ/EryC1/StrS family aminotransferase [Paenibacillus thiaminolyticus]WII36427.1 DegT/DnrJ/EryC1/StrS family aminotransferase [Paenibacillus thiaminolyticus]
MKKYYPIAAPILNGNEKKYVADCLDSTWISSNGSYLGMFEQQFAAFCQTKHAITCSNGTTALHLALIAHGVEPGDEVIVPTLTFAATANAVAYCGATPVFVDSEPETWNMDPKAVVRKITPRTKGIIAVHLYGHPVHMDPIMQAAREHGLFVIEDAAEAIGAEYKGRRAGSLGHTAAFSLFGNKIITTGEGGIITTDDDDIAENIRLFKGQGMDKFRKYWHTVIGYNYRMTNIQAAIGCAQVENIDWHIQQRIRVAMHYYDCLQYDERISLPVQKVWSKNVYWMMSVVLNGCSEAKRDRVMERLKEDGIETRPFFYPMHILPPYRHLQPHTEFPVANRIAAQGINLPSHGILTEEDIHWIGGKLQSALDKES